MNANIVVPQLSVTQLHENDVILMTVPFSVDVGDINGVAKTLNHKFKNYPVRVAVIQDCVGLSIIRQPVGGPRLTKRTKRRKPKSS